MEIPVPLNFLLERLLPATRSIVQTFAIYRICEAILAGRPVTVHVPVRFIPASKLTSAAPRTDQSLVQCSINEGLHCVTQEAVAEAFAPLFQIVCDLKTCAEQVRMLCNPNFQPNLNPFQQGVYNALGVFCGP